MHKHKKSFFNLTDDVNIIKAIIKLFFFVFFAKLLGLIKEIFIARQFGISPDVDAFNFTLSFVQWPVSLFGSVVVASLVPLISKIRSQDLDGEIILFRSELLGVTSILSFIVMLVFYVVFDRLLSLNVFDLKLEQINLVADFLPYFVWVIPLGFLAMLFSTWTISSQRHVNTLLEAMPALVIIVLVILLGTSISMVYGLVIGFLLQALVLAFFLSQSKEIEWPRFKLTSHNWSPLLKGLSFMIIGQLFMSLISLVDQYFAAGLGLGAISILSFSEKVLAIVLSLGVVVIGRAVLPIFSDAHNQGRSLKHISIKWVGIMFVIGLLASLVFYGYSENIVKIIFERGSFNASNTIEVSRLLRLGSLQIPFYIGGMVLSYAIISLRLYKTFVFLNGFLLVLKVVVLNFLINLGFEITSIPISSFIIYIVSFFSCLIYLLRQYK